MGPPLCPRSSHQPINNVNAPHVRNRDMLTMTLVSGAVSAVSMLGHFAGAIGVKGSRLPQQLLATDAK